MYKYLIGLPHFDLNHKFNTLLRQCSHQMSLQSAYPPKHTGNATHLRDGALLRCLHTHANSSDSRKSVNENEKGRENFEVGRASSGVAGREEEEQLIVAHCIALHTEMTSLVKGRASASVLLVRSRSYPVSSRVLHIQSRQL